MNTGEETNRTAKNDARFRRTSLVICGGLTAVLLLVGATCPKIGPGDYSWVLITVANQRPGNWMQGALAGDYHHIYSCPGDTVTIWWNDKGVNPAQISNVPNQPLQSQDYRTFTVPAAPGDTIYHISEGQDIYPGARDATNTVVGPNGGAYVLASAGQGAVDTVTGQISFNSTLLTPLFSKGLRVKSITILENGGVPNVTWKNVSMKDESGIGYTFPDLQTQNTLELPLGNKQPLRGYWYFAPTGPVNTTLGFGAILIRFEVFCAGS